ncbi:MAG: CDP-glycerol glycerophosphotransferase family protein, partial [Thermotogota bacterium]|nr:CDP-glycerol glycerophosphotransferase family protein [Thermotogota bacterium]
MSKNKKILFVTHHNNDFDHFLPLIVNLKKKEGVEVKVLAFYTKYEILKNLLHRHICNEHDIRLVSISDLFYFKLINLPILRMYKYVIDNRKLSDPGRRIFKVTSRKREANSSKNKHVSSIKSPKESFFLFLEAVLIRYIVLCSIFLLPNSRISDYLEKRNIDLIIIDQRTIDETLIDMGPITRFVNIFNQRADPMDLILFRFIKVGREQGIPIFMMPHGPQPISIPNICAEKKENIKEQNSPFRPDFLVVGNEKELLSLQIMRGTKSTFLLGDPRFDINWINYLESCALIVYKSTLTKPKGKTVLLYLVDIFTYMPERNQESNQEYKLDIHKDILSLVNDFEDLEVWVKHHPRHVYDLPLEEFIEKDRQDHIKQFGNDTDTNILIAHADICLALSSTTFISPIIQRKPVIFYEKWKEKLPSTTSIYDDLEFKASSKEVLI